MSARRHAFPRQSRLAEAALFARASASRNRYVKGPVQVTALANGKAIARLGMAISRRATKTAVARNRLKRVAREVFRLHQHELAGWDLVISVTSPTPSLTSKHFRTCLDAIFDRLKGLVPH